MLDIKFLVENTDKVKEALSHRNGNFEPYIDSAVENEKKRKQIIAKVETLKATRNTESDNIAKLKKAKQDASELIASMQQISAQIKELDAQQAEAEANIRTALLAIPNIPKTSSSAVGANPLNSTSNRNLTGLLAKNLIFSIGLAREK